MARIVLPRLPPGSEAKWCRGAAVLAHSDMLSFYKGCSLWRQFQLCAPRQRQGRNTSRQRQPYHAWHQFQPTYAALASVNVSVAPALAIIATPAPAGENIALGIGIFDEKCVPGRPAGAIFWDPVRCLYAEPGDDELNSLSQDEHVVCCGRAISKCTDNCGSATGLIPVQLDALVMLQ